mmetsp:Transcript_87200/g.255212  ORF Transcript_87200/g.255212 Transcript_87200/m.255212 type:complete len:631 (-) Transcript_87200:31-1923(-)
MVEAPPATLPVSIVAPIDCRPSTPKGPADQGNPEPLIINYPDEIPVPGSIPGSIVCSSMGSRTGSKTVPDSECGGSTIVQVGTTRAEERGSTKIWQSPANKSSQGEWARSTSKPSVTSGFSYSGGEGGSRKRTSSKHRILEAASRQQALAAIELNKDSRSHRFKVIMRLVLGTLQKYSLPLVLGVLVALVWNNVDEVAYHDVIDGEIIEGAALFGADLHGLSLHFIVNDIFMCFFFGLAIKEVTEALLPGGSLYPLRKAVNPLLATCGGVVGPVATYAISVALLFAAGSFDGQTCVSATASDGHRRLAGSSGTPVGPAEPCTLSSLLRGWGVPTATDISLAWMFALLVFGAGHPAINFLLLLAIVDDALGVLIIAIFYPDPNNPVQPEWLGLVVAAMVLAFVMRKLKVPSWPLFILICGPFSWLGLLKSHVHPALALVVVVPFMPASHALEAAEGQRDLGACDLGPKITEIPSTPPPHKSYQTMKTVLTFMTGMNEEEAPLHQFEHQLKLPVDLGMFFFGLANAGVRLGSVGGITASVGISLLFGKMLGIAGFSLLGVQLGFGLPDGLTVGSLFAMSAIAGVGLTVALFVANEAFVDIELQGQAKMGAVLSVAFGAVGWAIQRLSSRREE